MKKDNLFIVLFIILFFIAIKYFGNDINNISKEIDNLITSLTEERINIDNNEIYSYSENKESKEDVPSYYKNYEFDKEIYIYYSFLDDNKKLVYKQIYENAIIYNKSVNLINTITVDELKTTIEALYNDHPELFYLDTNYTYKYNNQNEVVEINLQYNDLINNIEENKKKFDDRVNTIVAEAKTLSSDFEKEKYVYRKLLDETTYDKNATLNQSAYSSLILGKSVCAGYSRAFQLILQKLEIPTYYVLGTANEEHAWNIVKLSGEYYNVDLTWDDTGRRYSHFNITDKEISKTHERASVSRKLPKCIYNTYTY